MVARPIRLRAFDDPAHGGPLVCTVSIISPGDGVLRLACNRDELWSRPDALPPRLMHFGQRQAALPIDPQSGGTWMAVNDAGLTCAILNARRGRDFQCA